MVTSWLTLSNRLDNLKLLRDYIRAWGQDRGLSRNRQHSLEIAAKGLLRHVVLHGYRSAQPGAIAIAVQE